MYSEGLCGYHIVHVTLWNTSGNLMPNLMVMEANMVKTKVLVTGLSGTIGHIIGQFLGDKYEMSGLDLSPAKGFNTHVADLSDLGAITSAFKDQDVVVHLGAAASGGAPWESVLKNNIVGTYNVMEASREMGVKRVVFASTNHVAGYVPQTQSPYNDIFEGRLDKVRWPFPLISAETVRPCCYYAVGKSFGESLGSFYNDRHGISFIAIRIGGVLTEHDWQIRHKGGLSMWLSHRDAAQIVERSIDAPASVGFTIVYGISGNSLRIHEIESAERVLGYVPEDDAGSEFAPEMYNQPPYLDCAN